MIWTQAFNPALVLGQNKFVSEVREMQKSHKTEQYHDIKMTYFCDKTWDIRATMNATKYTKADEGDNQFAARFVNNKTCQLLNKKLAIE